MGPERAPCLGPLAQLVRALPCHGRGRRFKSDMDRKLRPDVKALLAPYGYNIKTPETYCGCQSALLQLRHSTKGIKCQIG